MAQRTVVSIVLLLLLPVGLLFATGAGEEVGDGAEEDQLTFSYWVPMHPAAPRVISSYEENHVYQELERRTGVDIEWIHVGYDQQQQEFNLLIASGDYPDIIESWYTRAIKGGPDKAIQDGVYLRLNELMEAHAPNYTELLDENPNMKRDATTDEGNIWGFDAVQPYDEPPWAGPVVRKDWLDELGMDIPETIADWDRALSAFKDELGVEYPLVIPQSGYHETSGFLLSAYGLGPNFFQVDNDVKFFAYEPAYKDYLAQMNEWYEEGLIDPDFATTDQQQRVAFVGENRAGVFENSYSFNALFPDRMEDPDDPIEFAAAPYPTLNDSEDQVGWKMVIPKLKPATAVITTATEHPEEAVEWFDYHYGDEGYYLFNYGVEGESYDMVDGEPVFKDFLADDYWNLVHEYKLHFGPYLRNPKALPAAMRGSDVSGAQEVWDASATGDYFLTNRLTMTPEEGPEFSSIMSEVNTYVEEMTLRFIMGVRPLSDFEAYRDQLDRMGIEEAIELQQAAYERYLERL
jgi:putative aldouronate transport system substrate-binding protein